MSGSPDRAPAAERDPGEDADPATPAPSSDMATLVARGDAPGLVELARALRSGTGGAGRDLARCLACYVEAARLGSAEAEYSVALFHLSGGVVPQDLKEGAAHLRIAADGGFLPARVYLANLYELGVHFAVDPAKADVWYRSAARAAGIDFAPESPEYARAMADLGCARHCLALAEDATLPEGERQRLLKKAKAYGYQLVLRREGRASITGPSRDAATPEAAASSATEAPGTEPAERPRRDPAEKPAASAPAAKPKRTESGQSVGGALAAFLYASLFVSASIAAGYFLTLGAGELLHRGVNLSVLAQYPRAVFPAVVVLFGILPAFLMYKAMTVLRACLVAGLLGGAGYAFWGAAHTTLIADREVQALVLGGAGFLAALLVLGLLGGAKPKRRPPPRILT